MKTTETKTSSATSNQVQKKQQPFFNKEGEGGFFSKSTETTEPFFSPNTVQTKLTIGKPNDKYEVEADSMADKVVQKLSEPKTVTTNSIEGSGSATIVQKKCSACEEEKLQKKEDDELLQNKLEIQRKPIFESNDEQPEANVQTKAINSPVVQTKCATCSSAITSVKAGEQEEKLQKKEEEELSESELSVQTKSMDSQPEAPSDLQTRLNSTKGSGSSLSSDTQSSMGSAFGVDFSSVKVHTGSEAVQMNEDLGAQAFTNGNDIYFNEGKYDTNSTSGNHLLAHELTHTVQQNSSSQNTLEEESLNTTNGVENNDKSELDIQDQTILKDSTNINGESNKSTGQVLIKENVEEEKGENEPSIEKGSEIKKDKTVNNDASANEVTQNTAPAQTTSANTGGSGGSTSNASTASPALELNSESSTGLLNSLSSSTPSAFIQGMGQAPSLVAEIQKNENIELENSLPEITQPTGLPTSRRENSEAEVSLEVEGVDLPVAENEVGPLQIDETHEQVEGEVNVANIPTPRANTEEDQNFTENIRRATSSLPTSDSTVNTSAGTSPSINLTGGANPNLNEEGQQESNENVLAQQQQADGNVSQDFGENNIYPEYDELEQLRPTISVRNSTATSEIEQVPFPEANMEVISSFDNQVQASMNDQVGIEMERNEQERERMNEESENERIRGMEEIDQETEQTRLEQETAQTSAREEVAGHQQTWREENEAVRDEYSQRSSERRTEIDAQIDAEVTSTEQQVETELINAEGRAETERQNTEREARTRRAEAERQQEGQGFWDRVTSAVSDFFDALKEGLNILFDGLRQLVAGIIEIAKAVVNTLIDVARNLIVGFIEQFGEFLKGLVDIVLAAFPEIAERVKGWIDQAVEVAVNVVNTLADTLKEIANAILDTIGAVLDFILAAYQAFYNALLDVLAFIAGGLIKIIQFLWSLIEGASYAPGEFFGALAEEALGGNPADPLKDIEVPIGQEANWASAMRMDPTETSNTEEPQNNEMSTQLHQVLTRSELSDDDVELEPYPAVELSPELMTSLSGLQDDETMELGGAGADVVTTAEFQASAADDAGYSLESQAEDSVGESVEESTQTVDENTESAETLDPDWRNMNDEGKLDHYNAQMLVESAEVGNEAPTPDKVNPQPTIDNSPEALITKTGRLGIAQRLAFMGRQMMTGLQVFWNKNKGWIIAALVTALLAAGLIAFFTGGAGLALAVDIIIKAMIIIFGAYAVYQALGHIWDYVKKAWAGDAVGAGKSLAKAMAVIVMEFLLDKILLGMGKVFKRILKAVKNTRIGRAVRRGLVVVRRGRNAVRRTIRRGISKIKGNKLVVSMRNAVGRRVKSFNKLRESILRRFGFRRIWFEKHGRWIELWGEFNAKIMLFREDGEVEFRSVTDGLTKKQRQSLLRGNHHIGGRIKNPKSTKVVVSDSFEDAFKKMPDAERREVLDAFRNGSFARRRGLANTASDPIPSWARGTRWEVYYRQRYRINTTYSGVMNADDQIHHLVSMENLSHPLTQKGIRGGFDINHATANGKRVNTFSSQTRRNASNEIIASRSGIHASHPNYTAAQRNILDRFEAQFSGASNADASRFLQIMSQKLDNAINTIPSTRKIDELFTFGNVDNGILNVNDFYIDIIRAYRT